MKELKYWTSILVMMFVALVMGGKNAQAEDGLQVVHDGVPTLQQLPLDRECLLVGRNHERVCSRLEGILMPADATQRGEVRAAVRDRAPLYRAIGQIARYVREMRCASREPRYHTCLPPDLERQHRLRNEALDIVNPLLTAACGMQPLDVCVPMPEVGQLMVGNHHSGQFNNGENLAEALDTIQARLEGVLANAICTAGCFNNANDRDFCQRFALGELTTYDWVHAYNETGGAQRCNDATDPTCRPRAVTALSVWSCESVHLWYLNTSTVMRAMAARRETDRLVYQSQVQREQELVTLQQQVASDTNRRARQPPTAPALVAARTVLTEQEVADFKRRARAASPFIPRASRRVAVRQRAPRASVARVAAEDCSSAGTQGLRTCRVPSHGLANLLASPAVQGADGPAAAGIELFTRNLDAAGRARVQQALSDTPNLHSPIIFYCRRPDGTRFVRRAGIHRRVNGDDVPMTPARFVQQARTPCGQDLRIGVWGIPGRQIMLRFSTTSDGQTARAEVPRSNYVEASLRGTQRNVTSVASYGPPTQPRHLDLACYAEVRAFASMTSVRSLDRTS